ncbi:hypothetical protein F5146DRAFT_1176254 [Armillaria mellea]|nr:hypothetical protein F5146DRAFT_1176254 [Armillaria mellea]
MISKAMCLLKHTNFAGPGCSMDSEILREGFGVVVLLVIAYRDDNQLDEPNEHYLILCVHAHKEGDEMGRCFREHHEAYDRGDHVAVKFLSNQGKDHQWKMEQLNKEASNFIYLKNNRVSLSRSTFAWGTKSSIQHREPGEINLHGLYVKEAITYTDAAIKEAKLQGASEIRIIVGKGLHSRSRKAILRPAFKDLMDEYQLVAEFDPLNSSILVIELNECPPTHHRDCRCHPKTKPVLAAMKEDSTLVVLKSKRMSKPELSL